MDRTARIMRLINDPDFVEFTDLKRETSFFNVVGRTHTETWHSSMLGWLLNPASNHGLGDFGLRRLVMLMVEYQDPKAKRKLKLTDFQIEADFSHAEAQPNERNAQERSIITKDKGDRKDSRIDVLIEGIEHNKKHVSIMIEMKVHAPIDKQQCEKYLNHVSNKEREHGEVMFPVFITPEWNLGDTNLAIFGSNQWIPIRFQFLYDELIAPCLANNRLSDFGKVLLEEYVKTLRFPSPRKGNQRMAITNKERELADKLQENYADVLDALFEILRPESKGLADSKQQKKPIKISVQNQPIQGASVRELYQNVLDFLVSGKYLEGVELPIATGSLRYLLAEQPFHPRGNPFRATVKSSDQTISMEANKSREAAIRDLFTLFDKIGLKYEKIN